MENERDDTIKGKKFLNFICLCIFIVSIFLIYDVLLNNQGAVVNRAHSSAIVYSSVNNLSLDRTICEYSAGIDGLTACNLVFTNGEVRTLMCVGGFYTYVVEGNLGCYPVGRRNER